MTTLRINHMSLQVRDLARSSDFYQRVLKLPEVECLAARPNIRWFGIGAEHTVHLIEGDFADTKVTRSTHLCITTSDFEATIRHVESTGTAYCDAAGNSGKIHTRADGVHSIYFQDPDGYWIEVSEEFEAAKQL